jgi:peptide deformylase
VFGDEEARMPIEVLELGHPTLRAVSAPVADVESPAFRERGYRLIDALEAFRIRHGFGRAIAAPQIGISRRFIALNLGDGPFLMINPEVTWRSEETFRVYDDCMSFPWFFVRLDRHRSISVAFLDESGNRQAWEHLDEATSELLQHEVDHLDGILAVDRVIDRGGLVSRKTFTQMGEYFRAQVDYVIPPLRQ